MTVIGFTGTVMRTVTAQGSGKSLQLPSSSLGGLMEGTNGGGGCGGGGNGAEEEVNFCFFRGGRTLKRTVAVLEPEEAGLEEVPSL